jgi:hypothetical protein
MDEVVVLDARLVAAEGAAALPVFECGRHLVDFLSHYYLCSVSIFLVSYRDPEMEDKL